MKSSMKKVFSLLVVTAIFTSTSFSTSALDTAKDTAKRQMLTYQDLFNLEYAANPTVMPDGKHILYERRSMMMMTDRIRRNLWMVSLDGKTHRPLMSGKANYYGATFSDDGSKMAYISSKEGSTQIYVRHMQSGQSARVTDIQAGPSGLTFSPDGKWIAFSMFTPAKGNKLFSIPFKPKGAEWAKPATYIDKTLFQRDGMGMRRPGNRQVYIVPADGGTPRQITTGAFDHPGRLMWTPDSQKIVLSANRRSDADFDVFNSDLHEVDIKTGTMTQLTSMTGPEGNPTLSPDGKTIAFTGFEDNGKSNQLASLYIMKRGGSGIKKLTGGLDRSVESIEWAADGSRLYFAYDDHGKKKVGTVTLKGKRSTLTDALGGQSIGRPYTSGQYRALDDGRLVITLSTGDRPADLGLVDTKGKTTKVTDLNGDLFDHKTINKPELMEVKSSVDERLLQAWIVKPPHFDPSKKYPMILEIHGGPHKAYGPEFSTEVQMFAAHGYVVVYGNPRGSTSQGAAFANLIDKNYPSEDYNDLMDMVDGVINKGYVDTDNLFVTGGSGGGVLTAWIIGKTDRFKAAVVAKPVINWISMVGTSDIYTFMTRYWFTDTPWNDVDQYWRRSPLSLVGNVTTPTMVLTGELDVRTPMGESEQYYGALRLQKVESALVRIQGAYHGIAARPSNLARKIGHIVAWFDKYKDQKKE